MPQPWLHPVELEGDGIRLRAFVHLMSIASSRPAPIRVRPIGWFRCHGRTSVTTPSPTWNPLASWPRARSASPGAWLI